MKISFISSFDLQKKKNNNKEKPRKISHKFVILQLKFDKLL